MASSSNGERNTDQLPPTELSPNLTANGGERDQDSLRAAMQLADVIRKHEQQNRETTTTKQGTTANDATDHPLQDVRDFLETPGVKEGCIAAGLCLGAFFPMRKVLLRIADQRLNLGTVFPDLIVTPPLVIMSFQIPLFAGTLYGSQRYMERLAAIPADSPSPTADAICNDPIVISTMESQQNLVTDDSAWDPRQQTVHVMQNALKNCQERRAYQQTARQFEEQTPKERISWWKKR